ncbi:MAG: aspartate carbamoyltransferase catalytic subunit [Candidatus Kapaibacterium sp.]|nr:aspartate carbamoyltransferase catalytic subunit [Ignavibacteriota bacterium]MCB9220814.1 aspartate carbamoyltransferase catalytic subunit [Ignavibacteria bacterium]
MKDLFAINQLTRDEIEELLKTASKQNLDIITDELKNKRLLLAFFEHSTRTKISFEIAAKNLGIQVIDFMPELSSINKGETLLDTFSTLESMGIDAAIIRHKEEGTAKYLSQNLSMSIINGGDGTNQHPTQALLDLLTLTQNFSKLENVRLTICGDILHSRVAKSNIDLLKFFGVDISLCGPKSLIGQNYNEFNFYDDIDLAVENSDVVMCLRIQQERMQQADIPNVNEYYNKYSFKKKHFETNKEIYLMHPGPVNYGVEIENGLQTHERCLINSQVKNGVLMRMAILKKILNDIGN